MLTAIELATWTYLVGLIVSLAEGANRYLVKGTSAGGAPVVFLHAIGWPYRGTAVPLARTGFRPL